MIKWVTVYNNRYCEGTNYRVLHETNRLYEYYEQAPKTVARFIEKSKTVVPYHDEVFKEDGYTYWA